MSRPFKCGKFDTMILRTTEIIKEIETKEGEIERNNKSSFLNKLILT